MEFDRIYRYMDLKKFSDMVNNQRLCFVHFSKWKDQYEGLLFRINNYPQLYNILYDDKKFTGIPHDRRVIIEIFLKKFDKFLFGQSWTKSPNLWLFGDIRVELVIDKIKYIEGIEIKEIEYSDEKITEDIKKEKL